LPTNVFGVGERKSEDSPPDRPTEDGLRQSVERAEAISKKMATLQRKASAALAKYSALMIKAQKAHNATRRLAVRLEKRTTAEETEKEERRNETRARKQRRQAAAAALESED